MGKGKWNVAHYYMCVDMFIDDDWDAALVYSHYTNLRVQCFIANSSENNTVYAERVVPYVEERGISHEVLAKVLRPCVWAWLEPLMGKFSIFD